MIDPRPTNCRFRLQDEGKTYPRSSCQACGRTITTGLGRECADHKLTDIIPRAEADAIVVKRQKEIEAVVGLMEPYVNSVEKVTMRVMFAEYYHGAKFINVIGRRDGVEKRFEADWLKHLPRALDNARAALEDMLAEARRDALETARQAVWDKLNGSQLAEQLCDAIDAAIRAEAEVKE